jgi:sec-independent protein translocase protein TatA
MNIFSPRHLLLVLLIALLVFGSKRLRTLGADLGAAIRDFRKVSRDDQT